MRTIACLLAMPLSLAACSGDGFVSPDGSTDAGDGGNQDGGIDSGPISCGTTTCTGTEFCVQPCCGGAQVCLPYDDAGTCPKGTQYSTTCGPAQPCTYVCIPPPAFCSPTCPGLPQGRQCNETCA